MELIFVFLFHVMFFPYTRCENVEVADKSEVMDSLHMLERVEQLKTMQIQNGDVKKSSIVSEQPFDADSVEKSHDVHFEPAGELADSDEVVFSVLSPTKMKNELLSLDNNIFHELTMLNITATNTTETATAPENNKTLTVECMLRSLPEDEIPSVILANNSILQSVLVPVNGTNITVAECAVVLFYSSQCVFSARMAPHYNALARVFPGIGFYALDTSLHNGIHVRYGIVSVPNVLLFHNAKPVARFNDSHVNLENLAQFVTKHTTLHHNGTLNVTSADMSGPVPATLTKRIDYALILAWAFMVFCTCFWFLKSSLCYRIVECIRNTWNEAEAQHEHVD